MRFDIGDEVFIINKFDKPRISWVKEMDKTLYQCGVIREIHDVYEYKIYFEEFDTSYYYTEDAVGEYDEMEEARENNPAPKEIKTWYIAPISGQIFQLSGKDGKFNTFVNKAGEIVTDQYFTLKPAPKEIKGFADGP